MSNWPVTTRLVLVPMMVFRPPSWQSGGQAAAKMSAPYFSHKQAAAAVYARKGQQAKMTSAQAGGPTHQAAVGKRDEQLADGQARLGGPAEDDGRKVISHTAQFGMMQQELQWSLHLTSRDAAPSAPRSSPITPATTPEAHQVNTMGSMMQNTGVSLTNDEKTAVIRHILI